jgi:hypothetical protein
MDEITSFDTKVRPHVIDKALNLVHRQDDDNAMINHIVLASSAPGAAGAITTFTQEKKCHGSSISARRNLAYDLVSNFFLPSSSLAAIKQ